MEDGSKKRPTTFEEANRTRQVLYTDDIADKALGKELHDMIEHMDQCEAKALREAGNPWGLPRAIVKCRELRDEYSQIISEISNEVFDFVCDSLEKTANDTAAWKTKEEAMTKKFISLVARRMSEDAARLAATFKKLANDEIAGTIVPRARHEKEKQSHVKVNANDKELVKVFARLAANSIDYAKKLHAMWNDDVRGILGIMLDNDISSSEREFAGKFRSSIASQMQQIADALSKFRQ